MPEFRYFSRAELTLLDVDDHACDVRYCIYWAYGVATVEAWKDGNSTWSTSRVF